MYLLVGASLQRPETSIGQSTVPKYPPAAGCLARHMETNGGYLCAQVAVVDPDIEDGACAPLYDRPRQRHQLDGRYF